MSDLNNKDPLEELFRKKTGDYDISYREEDWDRLENRLDALDAQYAARRNRRIAAAAILLVFSLLSFFIYQNNRQIHSLNEQLEQNSEIVENPSKSGLEQNPVAENNNNQPEDTQPNQEGLTNPDSPGNRSQKNQPAVGNNFNSGKDKTGSTNSSLAANTPEANTAQIEQVDCPECRSITLNTGNYVEQTVLGANTSNTVYVTQSSSFPKSNRPSSIHSGIKNMGESRFTAGILMGPDFSAAGSVSDFHNPGSKIGLNIDYNLNRNWGISIGVIRSNVRYKAGPQEYRAPQGYWYNGIEASSTAAECVLLDIPINLTYRFLHFNNSRLYASAGISSYIMLTEDYKFSYEDSYEELPKRWKEKTGTTHLFSNTGISLGYEQDLFRSISIRAEPFIRLPLREVGWGNVNLYSVGSIFSVHVKLDNNQFTP